jgi:LysM repeat protein
MDGQQSMVKQSMVKQSMVKQSMDSELDAQGARQTGRRKRMAAVVIVGAPAGVPVRPGRRGGPPRTPEPGGLGVGASRRAFVEGARSRRRAVPAVFWRRRLMVLVMVGSVVLATLQGLDWLASASGTAGPVGPAIRAAAGTVYVVRPGDTLWSIGHRFDPAGDERPLVQELSQQLAGRPLQPGEALSIP